TAAPCAPAQRPMRPPRARRACPPVRWPERRFRQKPGAPCGAPGFCLCSIAPVWRIFNDPRHPSCLLAAGTPSMSADSSYARVISDLGRALGMTGLAPSDEGICQLVFDGRQVVQIMPVGARGLVLLSCRLADHGIDARQADRMARANFMQAGHGVVLCVAPDGRPHMQVALKLAE